VSKLMLDLVEACTCIDESGCKVLSQVMKTQVMDTRRFKSLQKAISRNCFRTAVILTGRFFFSRQFLRNVDPPGIRIDLEFSSEAIFPILSPVQV